jgi:predicted permease
VDMASSALSDLPRGSDVHVNAAVLAFSLGATIAAGVLFGLAPAFRAAKQSPADALRAGGRGASPHQGRLGAGLVVFEVALSLTLLVGSGLLLRSFAGLLRVPAGFRPDGLVSMQISLPTTKYGDPQSLRAFMARLEPALGAIPGVAGAAASMSLPPLVTVVAPYQLADGPQRPIAQRPFAAWTGVTPSYFATMGIPLLAGRTPTAADDDRAPLVVVISETLARQAWPGQTAVGKRMLVGRFPDFAEVVGVVGDVKNSGLAQPTQPQAYTPYAQRPWPTMGIVVRSAGGDPLALVNSVRAAVWSLDRDLPITQVETLAESLSGSIATVRVTTMLLSAFSAIALVIAAAGLYGVIAYTVERRTREVGIRMALGASAPSLLALVAAEGLRLVAAGMAIGLVAAAIAGRATQALLVGITATDPLTYLLVVVLFTATACAALILPARRALRVDPLVALRAD